MPVPGIADRRGPCGGAATSNRRCVFGANRAARDEPVNIRVGRGGGVSNVFTFARMIRLKKIPVQTTKLLSISLLFQAWIGVASATPVSIESGTVEGVKDSDGITVYKGVP